MQDRHIDRTRYFQEQAYTTKKYVIPYLSSHHPIDKNTTVLEIGCGEGGNLQPFLDRGCTITGIDILKHKIEKAKELLRSENSEVDKINLIAADIYDVSPESLGQFDIIMMRDVIEHIPNQEKFMHFIKGFMHSKTIFFLGFPPWLMPLGGHQQICSNRILAALPYYHILPGPIYRKILRWGGEKEPKIEGLMTIKATGITVERFKKIVAKEKYNILDETPYLINPNYKIKFNLKPRKQWKVISSIPYLRDFFTSCYYFILRLDNKDT